MAKKNTRKKDLPILLDITSLDTSVVDVVPAPENWAAVTDGIRIGWLNETYPLWLTAVEEEHGAYKPLRFDRFPLINTHTYEICPGLDAFYVDKREAIKNQTALLRENPGALGLAAPTPEVLEAILKLPATANLIREKAKEIVGPGFEAMEERLKAAYVQRDELAELRKQAAMQGYPLCVQKLVRDLVYEQSPAGICETVQATETTAALLLPLVCAIKSIRNLAERSSPELVVKIDALFPH